MINLRKRLYSWKCAFVRALFSKTPFQEGQIWRVELTPDERNARLLVYRIEPDEHYERVFYCVISTSWVSKVEHIRKTLDLVPMTEDALRRSVTRPDVAGCVNAGPQAEKDLEDFKNEYRNHRAGIGRTPLSGLYRMLRFLEYREAIVYPNGRDAPKSD